MSLPNLLQAAFGLALLTTPASAQGLRCSGFLHARDGSWRSLEEGPIFGPNGTVHVTSGEVLHATDRGDKGDLARALNGLCEGQ